VVGVWWCLRGSFQLLVQLEDAKEGNESTQQGKHISWFLSLRDAGEGSIFEIQFALF